MTDPVWVSEAAVKAMQAELIAEHGGDSGILNLGQLSSTLARPKNLFAYGTAPTLFELAAAYGYGLAKNHCFVDGNKRIATVVIDVFLQLNGHELIAEEAEVVLLMLGLAASLKIPEEDQAELAIWIESNSIPLT
ncbi:MAG TPA: type II toxin-antitoxin system death-on-curing family toxin [Coleofasciculaceae cyanobacterium]|jgi:death-on-curing protein